MRGLIEEQLQAESEPTYRVSHEFLENIGCLSPDQLPDYEALRHHPELEKALMELGGAMKI